MTGFQLDRRFFFTDRSGSINIMAAVSTAFVIGVLALGVDYGNLTLQRRTLQNETDLAAIVAASQIDKAEEAALDHFARNGNRIGVKHGDTLLTRQGQFPFDRLDTLDGIDGYAEIVKGRYTPDSSVPSGERFVAGRTPYNAVTVTTTATGELFFADSIAPEPDIAVKSTASTNARAAFSVGSRLASLNGGVLNKVLGRLLGTELSLSVMDYRALLDADVELFAFTNSLATRLHLTGVTYDELLRADMKLGDFIEALGGTRGLSPPVAALINGIGRDLGSTQTRIRLDQIMNLDAHRSLLVGHSDGLVAEASAFDLLNAAATAANAGKQIAVDLGATVPGLASVKLDLAIGEPPVGTPFLTVGQEGSIVRTAQTRLKVTATVDGLSSLAGLKIRVPLYVEVAYAEAALTAIDCLGGGPSNATVKIKAVPGVAEIAIGNVDPAAFSHFASTPRVAKATLVDSTLLKVAALGNAYASNLVPETLTFTPKDIANNRVATISTHDTLTSLTNTLLRNTDFDVSVLILTIGSPKAVQNALASTLSAATVPLDAVLYNTLLTLGIRIGEADIRVTGAFCQRPVLVQ